MLAVFKRGTRPRGILDLTAPADGGEGIVDRWLRETTARADSDAPGPAARGPEPLEEPTY